ncbi:MAG: hypothetical protein DWQ31_08375 [Planctomycetota bacterium]|nr:MAG: hypothetical protein DWQ31_08375 [Planctomycetota bacterium]REJ93956.1 MAG: hypothetical protein DWQ35_09300 [Planctomycetota bacterium]REK30936.1 MAG: hypothetical protein DWQ42_01125 [Planctomycetota bacterium]REK38188.1 MAG: hypothetical protein DWQ46_20860 [Planctomycetota bacterium]
MRKSFVGQNLIDRISIFTFDDTGLTGSGLEFAVPVGTFPQRVSTETSCHTGWATSARGRSPSATTSLVVVRGR